MKTASCMRIVVESHRGTGSPSTSGRPGIPGGAITRARMTPASSSLRSLVATAIEIPQEQLQRYVSDAAAVTKQSAWRPAQRGDAAGPGSLSREVLVLVGMAAAVSFVCSIDRAAMSVSILPMSREFDWDSSVKGAVASSFFAGYVLTNLCGGYLASRYSPKTVLALGVVAWSAFTMATPLAAGEGHVATLLATRAAMGVGEGVAYPSIQNLMRQAVPATARSRSMAFIYGAAQLGSVASYIASPALISTLGWRSVFLVFGSLGFVWLLGWAPLMQADRQEASKAKAAAAMASPLTPAVPEPPLRLQDVPWRDFACSKPFWAIVGAQVTVAVGSCLAFSWLPTYYNEVYDVDLASSAAFSVIPFVGTLLATNASGWIADAMINNDVMSKTHTRKVMQTVASLGPAACLLMLAGNQSGEEGGGGVGAAVAMVTAWLALGGFSAAGYGSNHQDISSRWAGVLFGCANGLASIAGSASIWATGKVLHDTHDWSLIFEAAAATYGVGAVVYFLWASSEEQFE